MLLRRTSRRRRRRRRTASRLAALPLLLAAAGAAGVLVRRRRPAGGSDLPPATVPAPPSDAPAAKEVEQTWQCQCGQEYRVSGEGLHRVYWVAGASVGEPVMDGRCPNCERALPGEHPEEAPAS
jgi:hypothetical protein